MSIGKKDFALLQLRTSLYFVTSRYVLVFARVRNPNWKLFKASSWARVKHNPWAVTVDQFPKFERDFRLRQAYNPASVSWIEAREKLERVNQDEFDSSGSGIRNEWGIEY